MLPFLMSIGFKKENVIFVPVSGLTGERGCAMTALLLVAAMAGPYLP